MSFLDTIKNLFNNDKIKTEIQTESLHKICKDNNSFSARLCTKNNQAIADKQIRFLINGVNYTRATDGNGVASLGISLDPGVYPIDIFFDGDDNYQPTKDRNTVHINPKIVTSDLSMAQGDGKKFQVKVTDYNDNPLVGVNVTFSINGVDYNRNTDDNGIAQLSINLDQGNYIIQTKVLETNVKNNIIISEKPKIATRMEGTNVTKTYGDSTYYQCAVYANNERIRDSVNITVNGTTYTKTADTDGLYKLNLNLNPGQYNINAKFLGNSDYLSSSVTNTITVNKAPEKPKCTNPYSSSPFHTKSGGGYLGQKTGYSCGPHALMQAYYNLTGIDVSEATLMDVCGTTTSGTSHQGLATGLAYLNRKYGTNVTMEWKDFSDVGYTKLGELLCDSDSSIFWHELYRNQWGHYSLANKVNTSSSLFNVLNSLGNKCGSPAYCGYQETRGFSTQKSYWNGISQKSICILRKG